VAAGVLGDRAMYTSDRHCSSNVNVDRGIERHMLFVKIDNVRAFKMICRHWKAPNTP
jgi:hypothetical protein